MELRKQGRKNSGISAQGSGLFVEIDVLSPFTSLLFSSSGHTSERTDASSPVLSARMGNSRVGWVMLTVRGVLE